MPVNNIEEQKNDRLVIAWLTAGFFMVMIQVLLGGITRLTGSGLSITEWQPLLGALPPLNQTAWQHSFEKYQQIAQFKKINYGFQLADYKMLFFWEWLHREWARLMGFVFIGPFLYFIFRKKIRQKMIMPLCILFILGALQGLIGWIMVKSGLNETDITVNPVSLAIHFICALCLLAYLFWFILKLAVPPQQCIYTGRLNYLHIVLLGLLLLQLSYGALMAGSHAALSAPTWPDINGAFVPEGLFGSGSLFHQLTCNPLIIQFIHRSLAYTIAIIICCWYYLAGKLPTYSWLYRYRWIGLLLITCQVILGVMALTNSMKTQAIYFDILHQLVDMLLFVTFNAVYFLGSGRNLSETSLA